MSDSLDQLRIVGNEYFLSELFKPKPAVFSYNKNALPIGRTRDGRIYCLDLTESFRLIEGGTTRSGKTFMFRGMRDRLLRIGRSVVSLTDIKNEDWSSRNPVQSKFQKLLLPGEKPTGSKVATFRPTYFKQIPGQDSLGKYNYWYSFSAKKFSQNDFNTFFNVEDWSASQKVMIDGLYREFSQFVTKDAGEFRWELFGEWIDKLEGYTAAQKNGMKIKFAALQHSHFYEKKFERDLIALIQKGISPSFNLEGYDMFGKGTFQYTEVFLAVVLREIVKARIDRKIPPVCFFCDEALRFVGNSKNTSFRFEVIESCDVHARYGVSWLFGVQDLENLPERILRATRYFLLPANCDIETLKQALLFAGMVSNQQNMLNEALQLKSRMSIKNHEWLIIDRSTGRKDVIVPLGPLSEHCETTI